MSLEGKCCWEIENSVCVTGFAESKINIYTCKSCKCFIIRADYLTFEAGGGVVYGWFGLFKNILPQASGDRALYGLLAMNYIFLSVGIFFARYFLARIFLPSKTVCTCSAGYFLRKSLIPHPPLHPASIGLFGPRRSQPHPRVFSLSKMPPPYWKARGPWGRGWGLEEHVYRPSSLCDSAYSACTCRPFSSKCVREMNSKYGNSLTNEKVGFVLFMLFEYMKQNKYRKLK